MAAIFRDGVRSAAKSPKVSEKLDREVKRLRFDVKQYDAQLKRLQRELGLKNSELKKLKSCGACTCLGDRRRGTRNDEAAAVRDIGTFGGSRRTIADRAYVEVHRREGATSADGGRRRMKSPDKQTDALRRSRTEFFQNGIHDADAATTTILVDKDRELARLHDQLAELRAENSSLREEARRGVQKSSMKDSENVRTLQELNKQVLELEHELLRLREERYRLHAENEQLRTDSNSKETNLLRCESQLTRAEREKKEYMERIQRLEERERRLTSELDEYKKHASDRLQDVGMQDHARFHSPSRLTKWNSDLALNRDGVNENDPKTKIGGSKAPAVAKSVTRNCNPYCEVCRQYRSKLVKHNYVQSGQFDGKVVAETREADRIDAALHMEEHDNRSRVLRRYMDESLEYERLLQEKDREISKLKGMTRDIEREYNTFRTKLLEKESNRLGLQRDLDMANIVKEKAEQARAVLVEECNKLQKQYQALSQDKMAVQRELQLCIDEQETQKRQLLRQADEMKSYERLFSEKDREISKLKGIIRDLETDYEIFRRNLMDQESNLLRLQRDLTTANASKEKTEKGRVVLVEDYQKLQQQYQKLYQDKAALQRELELCIEEQDKQKRLLQRYLDEIQSYEKMLAEKEKERMEMLLQFQANADRLCKCASTTS